MITKVKIYIFQTIQYLIKQVTAPNNNSLELFTKPTCRNKCLANGSNTE